MQAAQQAAEEALAEAAARDANGGGQQEPTDMDASSSSLGIDGEEMRLLRALHAAGVSWEEANIHQNINMLGLNSNDQSMQALLQMLVQQEQENARPEEHHLTIAQNGT